MGEHRRPATRLLHFVGTTGSIGCLAAAAAMGSPWLIAAAFASGYGFAWAGHFFVEKNRPATFKHPFLSLIGDFHMYGLMLMGRMEDEARRLEKLES